MSTRRICRRTPAWVVASALLLGAHTTAAQQLDQPAQPEPPQVQPSQQLQDVWKLGAGMQVASARSQERIDKLAEDTDRLLSDYRTVNEQIDSLRDYNGQLETLLASQNKEIGSLTKQIDDVTLVERKIMPLMSRMIETLADFVDRDVPFLIDERLARVANLEDIMTRADVTVAEKYRRLVEAYQIENEYGRTIESYRTEMSIEGGPVRTLDFLRVGRIILIYTTLDGSEAGVWNSSVEGWTPLEGRYRGAVRQALRIAQQQSAPDLIVLPVRGPRSATVKSAKVSQ